MERLEVTRAVALKVWWAYTWRVMLILIAALIVLAVLLGLMAAALGLGERGINIVAKIAQAFWIIAIAVIAVEVMRRVLMLKFEDFEIAIIPRQD